MAKKETAEKPIGEITHYFSNIGVAVLKLSQSLVVGVTIRIHGSTTDFEQMVDSMQIEHESIEKAKKGQEIGIKVKEKVREGDLVYKVE